MPHKANVFHLSVLLNEVISFLPSQENGFFLDVTAGGGGHFFKILQTKENWLGECWDTDPLAQERILTRAKKENIFERTLFVAKNFIEPPTVKIQASKSIILFWLT